MPPPSKAAGDIVDLQANPKGSPIVSLVLKEAEEKIRLRRCRTSRT